MWSEEACARCPLCGTSDWEWEEDEHAWQADIWRCHGCEAKDALRRQVQQADENASPAESDGKQIRLFRGGRHG